MKKIIPLLALMAPILISCSKRGPMGPPGPRGLDGITNVEAFEYEVEPSAWLESGQAGQADYGFYAPASFPEITNDILDHGTILGFWLDGNAQVPMPAILYQQGYQVNYDYLAFLQEVEFWKRASDNFTEAPQNTLYYKMVIVDNFYKNQEDLRQLSLEEIEERFNIHEYKKVKVE